jgi:hypothetical protein
VKSLIVDHSPKLTKDIMRATHASLAAALLGLTAILTLGCGDSTAPGAQKTGAIEILVSTTSTSDDVDPDGYMLGIDGQPGQAVGVSAMVTIGSLLQGTHLLRLDGVASNCSVRGPNPLSIYVMAGKAASPASFSVSCGAKGSGGEGGWDY